MIQNIIIWKKVLHITQAHCIFIYVFTKMHFQFTFLLIFKFKTNFTKKKFWKRKVKTLSSFNTGLEMRYLLKLMMKKRGIEPRSSSYQFHLFPVELQSLDVMTETHILIRFSSDRKGHLPRLSLGHSKFKITIKKGHIPGFLIKEISNLSATSLSVSLLWTHGFFNSFYTSSVKEINSEI